jgi:DNA-binding transcriptional regulator YiaG
MANHPNRAPEGRTLAQALGEYRERHNLTQPAVAEQFSVPLKTVQRWSMDHGNASSMTRALIVCLDRL